MDRSESTGAPRGVAVMARLLPFLLVLLVVAAGFAVCVFVPKLEATWASQGMRPPFWAVPLIALRRGLARILP